MPGPPKHAALIGTSPVMGLLRRFVDRAASVAAPVLLLGETGTGKSLLARAIHGASNRGGGPFVALNRAAVPEALFESELFGHRRGAFTGAHEDRVGLVETAHRGTVLLDEVGDLPPALQAKLLTVLEEGEVRPVGARRAVQVDVRVVSATSCELECEMEEGVFRRDLFHRLAVLAMRLPPLRERRGDIPLLADHFLRAASVRYHLARPPLDSSAVQLLAAQPWPGNVRELAHAVEAALILGTDGGFLSSLERVLAGPAPGSTPPVGAAPPEGTERSIGVAADRYSFYGSEDEERARIQETLSKCRGNRTRAACELGMSRNTLRDRMRRYRL